MCKEVFTYPPMLFYFLSAGTEAKARQDAAARKIAATLRSTSASVVAHDDTLMRIAVWPCQTVPPHQQVPSPCTRAITSRVRSGLPNDTKTWLSTTSFNTR